MQARLKAAPILGAFPGLCFQDHQRRSSRHCDENANQCGQTTSATVSMKRIPPLLTAVWTDSDPNSTALTVVAALLTVVSCVDSNQCCSQTVPVPVSTAVNACCFCQNSSQQRQSLVAIAAATAGNRDSLGHKTSCGNNPISNSSHSNSPSHNIGQHRQSCASYQSAVAVPLATTAMVSAPFTTTRGGWSQM